MGLASCGVLIFTGVSGLLSATAPGGEDGAVPFFATLTAWMLNIDLIVLAVVMICAELRIFRFVRKMVFPVIKHLYFVTTPIGRGLFYVFLASLSWDTDLSHIGALLSTIGLGITGVLTMFVHLVWGMPVFVDPQVADALMKKKMTQASHVAFNAAVANPEVARTAAATYYSEGQQQPETPAYRF
jgi:hypothetical protein